jgi:hypothetical protein
MASQRRCRFLRTGEVTQVVMNKTLNDAEDSEVVCKMSSEIAHGCAQNIENGFSFDFFLEGHHKDGDEFLNHIITGGETWVSCVNIETKEQSKQRIHTHIHQRSQKSLNKLCLPGN